MKADTADTDLEARFLEAYPNAKEASRRSGLNQIRRFLREPKEGDPVSTYDPDRRLYLLGTIAGPPEWREHPLPRFPPVVWTHEVSRDRLSASTRNSLGSALTVFRLPADVTAELFEKASPIGAPPQITPEDPTVVDGSGEPEAQVIRDTELRAAEFVEDRLACLDWKQMQELVAAVLRAMGYKTRLARKDLTVGSTSSRRQTGLASRSLGSSSRLSTG